MSVEDALKVLEDYCNENHMTVRSKFDEKTGRLILECVSLYRDGNGQWRRGDGT